MLSVMIPMLPLLNDDTFASIFIKAIKKMMIVPQCGSLELNGGIVTKIVNKGVIASKNIMSFENGMSKVSSFIKMAVEIIAENLSYYITCSAKFYH
jgi:hypothetical protein